MSTTRVRPRLSERDSLVLAWIGEQRGVRWDLLAWLLGREGVGDGPVSRRTWRGWCERMEALGYLTRGSLLGQQWVWLTQHGARMTGTSWNRYVLPLHKLSHAQAVGEVRFWLETREDPPGGEWVPEDHFRAGQAGKLSPYRRPDGAWASKSGNLIAVEVELHRKTAFAGEYRELVAKMPPSVDVVWWFTPTRQDAEWLAGKLEGSAVPCVTEPLPFLSRPLTHPEGCRCVVCRHAAREHPMGTAWDRLYVAGRLDEGLAAAGFPSREGRPA